MNNVDSLVIPMELADDIMNTQFYDKVDEYKTLYYKKKCILEGYVEKYQDHYTILFDFETISNGVKHEPYLCWIYNADIQQEFVGINSCDVDMLNGLPTGKKEILLIVHNSGHDCIFISKCLQNVRPIVKSNRCLQITATCYSPIDKHTSNVIVKGSYKLIPMPLRDFGKCFNLDCHKESYALWCIYTSTC